MTFCYKVLQGFMVAWLQGCKVEGLRGYWLLVTCF